MSDSRTKYEEMQQEDKKDSNHAEYEKLASDIRFQTHFIFDVYTFDIKHFKDTINKLEKIQNSINK